MDHETLNKLLGDMNKQDLIKLIDAMIQSDGKDEVILLEYCQHKSPPESVSLADENLLNRYWQNAWQMKYNALLTENSRRRLFLKIVNRG